MHDAKSPHRPPVPRPQIQYPPVEPERHFMSTDVSQAHAYAVSPRRVLRALTDADELAAWFGPRGVRVLVESVALEARVGGSWRLALEGDAERITVDGTLRTYAVPHLLEVEQQVAGVVGLKRDILLHLRLELAETTAGCELRVTHGPFPPVVLDDAESMWSQSLQRLETLVTPPR